MAADRRATYGGQAVIEGVMVRGQRNACIAVRRPDGSIALKATTINTLLTGRLRKTPIIRGIVALVESLALGMQALIFSAGVAAEAEDEEIGTGTATGVIAVSVTLGVTIFFLLPVLVSEQFAGMLGSDLASNIAEGLIRLSLFLGYIYLIGRMGEIHRVFMYHGAEHMTIHAQENRDPLTVESVRKYPTAHPRCGTAFLLTVILISILVFALAGRDPLWWLIASRVVLIPFVAAVSYEIIRWTGFHSNNTLVRVIAAPSLALQGLTTRVPDDDQIEIAIAAMNHTLAADADQLPQPTN